MRVPGLGRVGCSSADLAVEDGEVIVWNCNGQGGQMDGSATVREGGIKQISSA